MTRFAKLRAATCLTAALGMLPLQAPAPAHAAMISTDAVIAEAQAATGRERLDALLAREDVRGELARLGVSPDEARARVAALSDDEVRDAVGRLDSLPAGGDAIAAVIGAAILIFVILLITDIAGLTKVFPWTRSVR
ncbi:MAG: PA2779 family protein [Actinomycetota bacterium]